jgi:predicted nucleic acid-binding protein
MNRIASFWDASALVPLCVHEITTRQARSQLRKSLPVVWWGSEIEVHSAIARLHRRGTLSDGERRGALARLEVLSHGWREILPGDHVRELAKRLLDAHELRAADSMQLAAALTWCQQRPAGRSFVGAYRSPQAHWVSWWLSFPGLSLSRRRVLFPMLY